MEKENNISEKTLLEYLDAFGHSKKITSLEKTQYLEIAKAYNLNPFKRELHITRRKNKDGIYNMQLIVGYEVYLKRAERSGKLSGWRTWFTHEEDDLICWIEIHRKDWTMPLTHSVFMSEYFQEFNPIWKKLGKTMLRKVAISAGFRLAFPDELGGLPYEESELDGIESHHPRTILTTGRVDTRAIEPPPPPDRSDNIPMDIPIEPENMPFPKPIDIRPATQEEMPSGYEKPKYSNPFEKFIPPAPPPEPETSFQKLEAAIKTCPNFEVLKIFVRTAQKRTFSKAERDAYTTLFIEKAKDFLVYIPDGTLRSLLEAN